MSRPGRPLRFLAATLGGWVLLRTGMLWPTLEVARDFATGVAVPGTIVAAAPDRRQPASSTVASIAWLPGGGEKATGLRLTRIALGAASFLSFGRATPIEDEEATGDGGGPPGVVPPPLRPTRIDPTRRLTGSAWGILREGVSAGLPGGQLGGSQAGVRLLYGLGAQQRVALAARVSAPLEGPGAEAALGIEVRPAVLPVRIIAERRFALDPGRDGTAIYAVGGIAPTPVAAGFRLEAYGQGGTVIREDAELFADGAARVTHPVGRTLDIGVGAWGGAQRGAARLDVGPTIGVALPVAGRPVRVSLDWRQRIAGSARPGSGPALSIGSDF